ncbi:Uu.00g001640.m01.CDS01 [Anthostomella pinea]|uniref:Uu.00g001640.m01.CDS01 n=1 Tax=Anthostomella pinea TaxID=933095 RepID=A0AAI8VJD7_9PEZI|nr:Uu.00g001640.m01.CDS01 [Anthostomella pinea]
MYSPSSSSEDNWSNTQGSDEQYKYADIVAMRRSLLADSLPLPWTTARRSLPSPIGSERGTSPHLTHQDHINNVTSFPVSEEPVQQRRVDLPWRPRRQPQAVMPPIRQLPTPPPGSPTNYKGDLSLPSNQSADIPDSQNVSVYIVNLPPYCNEHILLGAIRGIGKIFACNVNSPDETHSTAAGKVVFWDRAATDRFLDKAARGQFQIGNYLPEVKMNRIRVAAQTPSNKSRVLQIDGPRAIANQAYLERLFRAHFKYDLDEVVTVSQNRDNGRTCLRIYFASFRCQAAAGFKVCSQARMGSFDYTAGMDEHEGDMWRNTQVHWGPDPCAIDVPDIEARPKSASSNWRARRA